MAASRVGARTPAAVPKPVKTLLEGGEPSVNHMEQIAMDMGALLATAFPHLAACADRLRAGGLVAKMREGGRVLHEVYGAEAPDVAAAHRSDTVRGWGAMALAASGLPAAELLPRVRPFADDEHFAVREWAWLAARPAVADDCDVSLSLLTAWTAAESPNLRRFASESTRPRGVWSVHLPVLKSEPERAERLLDALRADRARYVQDSVGNWLNDASRTRPDWVCDVCARWLDAAESPPQTVRIVRRALRTIGPDC